MNDSNPIQRLRKSLSDLMIAMPEGRDAEYQDVRSIYLEAEGIFNSPEFRRYKESFGKLALMAQSKEGNKESGLFDNFREVLGYLEAINLSISVHGQIRFLDVACLYTRLEVMELHHESIDEIFSRQS